MGPCLQQMTSVHVAFSQGKEHAAKSCHVVWSAAAEGDVCNQEICRVSVTARKGADLRQLQARAL